MLISGFHNLREKKILNHILMYNNNSENVPFLKQIMMVARKWIPYNNEALLTITKIVFI